MMSMARTWNVFASAIGQQLATPPPPPKPRRTRILAERFAAFVDLNGPIPAHRPELGPCHIFRSARPGEYGQFGLGGRTRRAHRVAFFIAEGRWPVPNACHHCDNRPCVRRSHLFEGTTLDNMRDMVAKGRHRSARVSP